MLYDEKYRERSHELELPSAAFVKASATRKTPWNYSHGSGFLSRRDVNLAVDSNVTTNSFLPSVTGRVLAGLRTCHNVCVMQHIFTGQCQCNAEGDIVTFQASQYDSHFPIILLLLLYGYGYSGCLPTL